MLVEMTSVEEVAVGLDGDVCRGRNALRSKCWASQ